MWPPPAGASRARSREGTMSSLFARSKDFPRTRKSQADSPPASPSAAARTLRVSALFPGHSCAAGGGGSAAGAGPRGLGASRVASGGASRGLAFSPAADPAPAPGGLRVLSLRLAGLSLQSRLFLVAPFPASYGSGLCFKTKSSQMAVELRAPPFSPLHVSRVCAWEGASLCPCAPE